MDNFEETKQEENLLPQSSPKKRYIFIAGIIAVIVGAVILVLLMQKETPPHAPGEKPQNHDVGVLQCDTGGESAKEQWGSVLDDIDDTLVGSSQYLDIYNIKLRSEEGESEVTLFLSIDGAFPEAESVETSYRFLLDTDNDTKTGLLILGFEGIEKEIRLRVSGNQANGPLTVFGSVIDHITGTEVTLPTAPELSHGVLLIDYAEPPDGPLKEPPVFAENFDARIPKDLLNLTSNEVSITVISQVTSSSVIADATSFVFDQKWHEKRPNLIIAPSTPGKPIPFMIERLTPNETFQLEVENTIVLTDVLNNEGSYNGSFLVPSLPDGDYFVTAQDATGEFAWNVIGCTSLSLPQK